MHLKIFDKIRIFPINDYVYLDKLLFSIKDVYQVISPTSGKEYNFNQDCLVSLLKSGVLEATSPNKNGYLDDAPIRNNDSVLINFYSDYSNRLTIDEYFRRVNNHPLKKLI